MHLLVDVGQFFSSQRVVLTILVELSSCNWLVPQSRSGIYLLIVKASVVTAADLAAFKDIFERSMPVKTQAPDFSSSVSQVRRYVAGVLAALET